MPWIVLGYAFLDLYFVPMNGITLGAGKSGYVWVVSAIGAASNVALLFRTSHRGILAAAIASAAAYLVLFICVSICMRATMRTRASQSALPAFRRIVVAAVGCVYVAARLTTQSQGVAAIVLRLIWIAGLAGPAYACTGFARGRRACH